MTVELLQNILINQLRAWCQEGACRSAVLVLAKPREPFGRPHDRPLVTALQTAVGQLEIFSLIRDRRNRAKLTGTGTSGTSDLRRRGWDSITRAEGEWGATACPRPTQATTARIKATYGGN